MSDKTFLHLAVEALRSYGLDNAQLTRLGGCSNTSNISFFVPFVPLWLFLPHRRRGHRGKLMINKIAPHSSHRIGISNFNWTIFIKTMPLIK